MLDEELMPPIRGAGVTLLLLGENLDPDEVSRLLGVNATSSNRKGEQIKGSTVVSRNGRWLRALPDRSPGNLSEQVTEVFAGLSNDAAVWSHLAMQYHIELMCYLYPNNEPEQFALTVDTLSLLATRRAAIRFIHFGFDDEAGNGKF